MKKGLLFCLAFCLATTIFAQDLPSSSFNCKKGDDLIMLDDAFFVSATNKYKIADVETTLPESLGKDVLTVVVSRHYYYDGKEYDGVYEIIYTDVTVSKDIKKMNQGDIIKYETVIGKSKSGKSKVVIRTPDLDVNLLCMAQLKPVFYEGFWYYGGELLMPTTPKFLEFQPITSKKSEIYFADYPDTLANLAASSSASDEKNYSSFPSAAVMFKTTLSAYPEPQKKSSTTELFLENQYFSRCPTSLKVKIYGTTVVLHFQQGFEDYLKNEYKLKDTIYLYCNLVYSYKGELHVFVRDYTLKPAEEIVKPRLEEFGIR